MGTWAVQEQQRAQRSHITRPLNIPDQSSSRSSKQISEPHQNAQGTSSIKAYGGAKNRTKFSKINQEKAPPIKVWRYAQPHALLSWSYRSQEALTWPHEGRVNSSTLDTCGTSYCTVRFIFRSRLEEFIWTDLLDKPLFSHDVSRGAVDFSLV